jgi:hypothetical protein
MTDTRAADPLVEIVDRLSQAAIADYYNPYRTFDWPDRIAEDQLWMSRDLLTVAGTAAADELSHDQLVALSKWESIHFYSLNVHGIRELLIEVVKRIHTPAYAVPTKFFHHFVGEENEHMWFFAEFCLRYGGKIYPNASRSFGGTDHSPLAEGFLVFSRILIFEQLVDYFNARMGSDATLDPTIQKINRIHHQDESRHIAFGGQLITHLYRQLCDEGSAPDVEQARDYVTRYLEAMLRSLYNPAVYRDAGIADPGRFRARVLADPARDAAHQRIAGRTRSLYRRIGAMH